MFGTVQCRSSKLLLRKSTVAVSFYKRVMSRARLAVDGKWAHICPQTNPLSLQRRKNPILYHINLVRQHSSSNPRHQEPRNISDIDPTNLPPPVKNFKYAHHIFKPDEYGGEWSGPPLLSSQAATKATKDVRILDLETRLRAAGENGDLKVVMQRLRQLTHDYRKQPTEDYYVSWVLGNCDHQYGSASALRCIWDELLAENIPLGSDIFHAFIKALSYHPDYLLRTTIFEHMEQRWVGLNTNGWNDLLIGLLRENQLALAVEKMQEMRSLDIFILEWIPPAVIHCLVTNGEYAEAVRLLEQQTEDGREAAQLNTWNLLLQVAGQDRDHEIVSTAWQRAVKPKYLNPSSGVCEHVLSTAARAGDMDLASKVFQTLAERKDAASLEVCEPMLETYIQSNSMPEAIELLCAMNENGLVPSEAALRPMIESRIGTSSIVDEDPLQILRKLTIDDISIKNVVPIELVNAIMEVQLRSSEPRQAKALFDDRTSVCLTPPNVRTFRLLFQACRQLRDLDSALAYYVEFRSAMPDQCQDQSIFIDLVDTCIATNEFSEATEFIVAAQDDGVPIVSNTVNHWMDRVNEQPRPHVRSLAQFVDKLEHMVQGEEIRKEIKALARASEEINPFTAAREAEKEAKEADKARQARVAFALRQWFKKEGEGHIQNRRERDQQERIAKDFLQGEVGKMLNKAASIGQRHAGTNIADLRMRQSRDSNVNKLLKRSSPRRHAILKHVDMKDAPGLQAPSPQRRITWKHLDLKDESEFRSRVELESPVEAESHVETEMPVDLESGAGAQDPIEYAELGKEEARIRKGGQVTIDKMDSSLRSSSAAPDARPSIGGLDELLSSMKETERKARRK